MWTVSDALEGCGGDLQGKLPDKGLFNGFSIDSRTIQKNNLFFALSGPNFEGHHFVEDAIQKGGSGMVVSHTAFDENRQRWLQQDRPHFFILVNDPLEALQGLAKWHRSRYTLPLVGLTGSNGKTTTKEMLATILSVQGNILKNKGNLNNHIGLPLSLLKLTDEHSTAVLEMGINKKGEMLQLCDIGKPTIGLITNIGPAHLEGLGSLKGVAEEKTLLFQSVKKQGTAIINRDDPFLQPWEEHLPNRWTFGTNQQAQGADITTENVNLADNKTTFKLVRGRTKESIDVTLSAPGRHQVANALAAAAAASALEIDMETISLGLSRFQALTQRTEILKAKGITILFDAYNANPASVRAALDLLISHAKGKGRRIALLGEMLELGEYSDSAHFEIGKAAAHLGIDRLITVGASANQVAEGARAGGLHTEDVHVYPDLSRLETSLMALLVPGDILLIKGSRGMKLERLLLLFGLEKTGSASPATAPSSGGSV